MKLEDIALFKDEQIKKLYLENLNTNPEDFILKNSKKYSHINLKPIAEQIKNYRKAKEKFPVLAKNPLILYDKIAIQQASSQLAGEFKATLFSGDKFIDLTGGMGLDTIFISKNFKENYYCEIDFDKVTLFKYNLDELKINNINIYCGDSIEYLKQFPDNYFDLIYIDPARRDDVKRFIKLELSQPNLLEIQDLLLQKSKYVLVKLAPAFDVDEIVKNVKNITHIYAIEYNYEMKEILVVLKNQINNSIKLVAKDLKSDFIFEGNYDEIKKNIIFEKDIINANYTVQLHPSVIKLHLTKTFSDLNNLLCFNLNSNISLGNDKLLNHRNYKVIDIFDFDEDILKSKIKKLKIEKSAIITSNIDIDVEKLRKKLKIKDSNKTAIILTTSISSKAICIIGTKID
ncbi:MAG TPA: RsmD family RNA methyltransferase [Ignavibacteriales bacterium]|nr:RsmD family RNA methyltransferase [Ignavibacteriales bacterium]HOL80723.1 RsmD family RNA methyltransferase [Ignavibacteriales bacterium]